MLHAATEAATWMQREVKSAVVIFGTEAQGWWGSLQGHLVINPHRIRAFRSFQSGQWAVCWETLTLCSTDLLTPFGTLEAGSYWLRQGWWNMVTAAFIFHRGSMETTNSSMQSSLLIQAAWQLKNLFSSFQSFTFHQMKPRGSANLSQWLPN